MTAAGDHFTIGAPGTISLTTIDGAAYQQNFDTLAASGTSTSLPAGWAMFETGSAAASDGLYTAGTGSSGTGDTYSFGSTGSTDRAFGTLLSGTITPTIGASFTNNTGTAIRKLTIAYTGEQWRFGATGRADRLDFQYSVDATSLTTGTWVDVDALDFNSPNTTSAVGPLDGNAASNRTAISGVIAGLNVASGGTFWIRWSDFNAAGADDGLGIDDFSLTPSASAGPSGVGTATPGTILAGQQTLLSVSVAPGAVPTSTNITVTADLSAIGGSATQSFFDDASNGDAVAGDNIFSFQATVLAATAPGIKTIPTTIADSQSRSASAPITLSVRVPSTVVISQVYGGGGNTGASLKNDFIELFNRSGASVSLNGWSVQYAPTTGASWSVTNLTNVTLQPGQYYLVQESSQGASGSNLPAFDATGTINMAQGAGKVALVNNTTALTGGGCPIAGSVVDLVGYGTGTDCFEGAGPTASPSLTLAAFRAGGGCTDTDSNTADFVTASASPRNTGVISSVCGIPVTNPTGIGSANPASAAQGQQTTLTVTVTPGTNPASTGISVSADLSSIGIAGPQAFTGNGNTFTYTATVAGNVTPGAKSLPVTIADEQSRSTSASIALTVTSFTPTATATAAPASVHPGGTSLLTVTVTPGSNPVSTGVTVAGDLSAIGGSAAQTFYDDGTNGDAVAGNNVFSYRVTVPDGTSFGSKALPIAVADAQGRHASALVSLTVQPPPPTIKISQVYGGGGNSGATYTNDFVELFNNGPTPVNVTGWSIQYSSATQTVWSGGPTGNLTEICPAGPCIIDPGHYFLVQEGAGAGGTTPLPAPDATGLISMGAGAAKIALMSDNIPLTDPCPAGADVVDFVGYGTTANCSETSPTANLGNPTAALRRGNGCRDSDNNLSDFFVDGPIPRNSGAPVNACAGDSTRPSGVGIASPDAIDPFTDTLITVAVVPASTPSPSTGLTVTANLLNIGGVLSQTLYDDGTHGDQVAGDHVFSFQQRTSAALAAGEYSMLATIGDAQGRSETAPITLTITSPTCGTERWAVKVGTDSTVGTVRLDVPPTPATILDLSTRPAPSVNDLNITFAKTRIPSGDVENTVFTVDATLTFYKLEDDVDYHIVIDDGQGHTLITEIPSPACVITDATPGSPRHLVPGPFAAGIANARSKFDARLHALPGVFQNAGGLPVRVKGVGFFDFEHGQTGVAPNAIELHPLLDIFFRGNTTTTLLSSGTPTFGQPLTVAATVSSGGGNTPTGDVTFFDSATGSSMTGTLDGGGQASFTTTTLAAGAHAIVASYPGDDASLPSSSPALALTIAKADQAIDFAALSGKPYGAPSFVVAAGGGASGKPVTFVVSGNCTASGLNGETITITGAGGCTVTASQAGSDNYNAAADVSRSFTIAPAALSVTASDATREFGTANPPLTGALTGVVNGDGITASFSTAATSSSPVGSYAIVPSLNDPNGRLGNYTVSSSNGVLHVVDTTPPAMAGVTPSPAVIWPPNKQMIPVTLAVAISDAADSAPVCAVTGITSNEPEAGDSSIGGPLTVSLRADRNGNGSGRVYTIAVRCVDASGNATTGSTTVIVPHDQGK